MCRSQFPSLILNPLPKNKSYHVMKGYWNDPENTRKAFVKGWLASGDLATIDENGYARIVGRKKDMIIRGGENIYPREIEEFLFTHQDIQDVQVFGVPDHKYGEQICAFVRKAQGSNLNAVDIRSFCRNKIAHFKIPHYIFFVEEFPLTVSGKPMKFVMRKQAIEMLGLNLKED